MDIEQNTLTNAAEGHSPPTPPWLPLFNTNFLGLRSIFYIISSLRMACVPHSVNTANGAASDSIINHWSSAAGADVPNGLWASEGEFYSATSGNVLKLPHPEPWVMFTYFLFQFVVIFFFLSL